MQLLIPEHAYLAPCSQVGTSAPPHPLMRLNRILWRNHLNHHLLIFVDWFISKSNNYLKVSSLPFWFHYLIECQQVCLYLLGIVLPPPTSYEANMLSLSIASQDSSHPCSVTPSPAHSGACIFCSKRRRREMLSLSGRTKARPGTSLWPGLSLSSLITSEGSDWGNLRVNQWLFEVWSVVGIFWFPPDSCGLQWINDSLWYSKLLAGLNSSLFFPCL